MDRKAPAPVDDERLAQAILGQPNEAASAPFHQAQPPESIDPVVNSFVEQHSELFAQIEQLQVEAKVALICKLMSNLDAHQIQAILEFGQREVRAPRSRAAVKDSRQTRLLLKKDYTYQERGLSQPTQYYVYLRRRKPKLDRYIGTLFYVPQGCTLSYQLDAEGRILFDSSQNVFQLQDAKDESQVRVVRLLGLDPPPPDYTFTKQQNDHPQIHLRLEYLDPKTHRPVVEKSLLFPFCMHEGGELDRYRWDVRVIPPVEYNEPAHPAPATHSSRRVLELPNPSATFFLTNRNDTTLVVERMQQWVNWSEKAMPQSRWAINNDGNTYALINASFKRSILSFSIDQASVTLQSSLPVITAWFHDLGLAVSQAQNQGQYTASQLKLAHTLFVDMSLPQTDPLVILKHLFGVQFSKTAPY